MLNYLWAAMIGIGVVWGAFTGQTEAVCNGLIESGKEAVELCITMLGVVGMWCGLMEVARRSGIVEGLTKRLSPVVGFLFPSLPRKGPAVDAICLNFAANILGLGWAATPAGLQAMKELANLRKEKEVLPLSAATDEMCTFLVMNISSLQLIPVNMIAYRSSYGSAAPAAITGPGILATAVSTLTAVIICKVMCKESKRLYRFRYRYRDHIRYRRETGEGGENG